MLSEDEVAEMVLEYYGKADEINNMYREIVEELRTEEGLYRDSSCLSPEWKEKLQEYERKNKEFKEEYAKTGPLLEFFRHYRVKQVFIEKKEPAPQNILSGISTGQMAGLGFLYGLMNGRGPK